MHMGYIKFTIFNYLKVVLNKLFEHPLIIIQNIVPYFFHCQSLQLRDLRHGSHDILRLIPLSLHWAEEWAVRFREELIHPYLLDEFLEVGREHDIRGNGEAPPRIGSF